jgi:ferredoxin, 2Fe-2S
MAVIVIKNLKEKTLEVQDFSKTILQHVQENGIDWMHACGGKGRCTTCKVTVVAGSGNLESKTRAELQYEKQGLLSDHERLACQARMMGDIIICVPDENKLPHLQYSHFHPDS